MNLVTTGLSYKRLFSDAEIERIYAGAITILQNKGFRILSHAILDKLENRGAQVDYGKQSFRPSLEMIHQLEAQARQSAPDVNESHILHRPLPRGEGVVYNAPLYFEPPVSHVGINSRKNTRRMAAWQDVVRVLQACHALPEVVRVGPAMAAQDVPPAVEPLLGVAEAIKTTDKEILAVELVLPEQLPYMEELETISRGSQVRYTSCGTSIDRFTIDRRGAEMLLSTWQRNGLKEWWVASCPTAGTTSPVTVAGSVVVGVAETLGGWFAGWALDDQVKLGLSPCSSVLDMRTTRVLFSTPEAVLIDAGQFQVFERLFGVRAQMLADYTDAKIPGMQAVNDKLFKSLSYEWLTCGQVNTHYGKLDAGKVFSPVQMLVDFEINRELAYLGRGVEVSEDTLALDLIEQVGLDHASSFLGTDHTLRYFRDAFWRPLYMDQTSWNDMVDENQKERQLIEQAEMRWQEAIAQYKPPSIPKEKLEAVDDVILRARRALLS